MFCPNCGKDCMEAKFCPECGQDLRKTSIGQSFADRQRESQGSKQVCCPQCLSTSITMEQFRGTWRPGYHRSAIALLLDYLDGKMEEKRNRENGEACVCMRCGYKWHAKQEMRRSRYRAILSKHLGAYSTISIGAPEGACLQLGENELRLYHSENNSCVIPYEEIADVVYQSNLGPLYGWLSIRDRAHKHKRFPKTFLEAKKDKLTIYCNFGYESAYQDICNVMKIIVDENKKEGLL